MDKKIFASDIDGTLIPHKKDAMTDFDIANFNRATKTSPKLILAYVTGRHLELALSGIKKFNLTPPNMLVCDVGTSIYIRKNSRWIIDRNYKKILQKSWGGRSRRDIANMLSDIKGLRAQEKEKQKEFKQSYYLPVALKSTILKKVKSALSRHHLQSSIIYSVDPKKNIGLLDILPPRASKQSAIFYLRRKLKISSANTAYAGDSGNDLDVFLSDIKSIVVKNTRDEVKKEVSKKAKDLSKIYFTRKKHSAGVLEGLYHFKFIKRRSKKLYIQMHSMHGLFRGSRLELGRDEDTGGQIVYVLELAKALSKSSAVKKIDIITRRILDKKYPGYSKIIERVSPKVNIVRIECGPKKYIKKVDLWPYLPEFIKNCKEYIKTSAKQYPDILQSNYADSGLVCTKLSQDLGIPQVHTGHSLGKSKMKRLGAEGMSRAKMEKIYHFKKRIAAEIETFNHASAIVASSLHEKNTQYGLYKVDDKKINIIWPGTDLKKFKPYNKARDKVAENKFKKIFQKSFSDPSLPLIFTLSRLDHRKNLIALIKSFAVNKKLRKKSNLLILVGPVDRKNITQKNLYYQMTRAVKKHHLESSVLIFDRAVNYKKEVPELYRMAARSQGVFANPSLIEPFGLTLLEAAGSGLPVVATQNGGPVNIIKNCQNGLLFDPQSPKDIARAILKILNGSQIWKKYSLNGIKNIKKFYSWDAAAKKELKLFQKIIQNHTI